MTAVRLVLIITAGYVGVRLVPLMIADIRVGNTGIPLVAMIAAGGWCVAMLSSRLLNRRRGEGLRGGDARCEPDP